MKIYTERGDQGETDLLGGSRVSKDCARIEAVGAVDELNACPAPGRDVMAQLDGLVVWFLVKSGDSGIDRSPEWCW